MGSIWQRPWLPVGTVLLVLGVGNWIVSANKLVEYRQRVEAQRPVESAPDLDGLRALTPETSETLLAHLYPGSEETSSAHAKLQFYGVVHRGGRILALLGAFLVAFACAQEWVRRRSRHDGALPI